MMTPPVGVDFRLACRIADVSPPRPGPGRPPLERRANSPSVPVRHARLGWTAGWDTFEDVGDRTSPNGMGAVPRSS
jgi:hypothetical protein